MTPYEMYQALLSNPEILGLATSKLTSLTQGFNKLQKLPEAERLNAFKDIIVVVSLVPTELLHKAVTDYTYNWSLTSLKAVQSLFLAGTVSFPTYPYEGYLCVAEQVESTLRYQPQVLSKHSNAAISAISKCSTEDLTHVSALLVLFATRQGDVYEGGVI